MLFDTHAHLNDDRLYSQADQVVERARQAGVRGIVNVGYDLESSRRAVDLGRRFPECLAAVGMHPHDRETLEFPFDKLKAGQLVADVIYRPETTRFLELAGKQGARTLGGFGMLLYQGALALEYWTGQEAPVAAMEEALRRSLDGE